MAWAVSADFSRFEEAIQWFLQRVVLSSDEAAQVDDDTRQRSFWIGGGLQLQAIQNVFDHIAKSLKNGEPFEDFKKRVKDILSDPAHTETVFRNAVQRSYNAGRYQQMKAPDVARFRPYWMFDAVLDSRTSTICTVRDKTILPQDNQWWASNIPPLHHRCRSGIRSLRKAEAERRGINNVPPLTPATPGWGTAPDAMPVWKPNPAKTDPELLRTLQQKQQKPPPPPASKPEHDPKFWRDQYAHLGEAAHPAAWGRAAQERGLDRSGAEVVAEAQRLRDGGHPLFAGQDGADLLAKLKALPPNRPIRGGAGSDLQGIAAVLEHTRSITPTTGTPNKKLPLGAQRFYKLTSAVEQPNWDVRYRPGRAGASPKLRTIFISHSGDVENGVHEWAHATESETPKALARSLAFLKARTQGEAARRLLDLEPGRAYRPEELARKDGFIHPYVGKDYGNSATEVTSMGYQWLASPIDLDKLALGDPEMLHFLLGQLAGQ
jgi:SPP1 gp7 family putative phage head morphogenesis protein